MVSALYIDGDEDHDMVDSSFFRFTAVRSELLVRPLDIFTTEPLF